MTVVDSVPAGAMTHDLKITKDGRWVVACNRNTEDITIVDTQADTVIVVGIDPDSVYAPTGSPKYGPFGVAIGRGDSLAFIACIVGDQVRVLNIKSQRIVDSIDVPHIHSDSHPHGATLMALSPNNEVIFVTTQWSNHVMAIRVSDKQVLAEIEFSVGRSFGISISDDGSRVYVACANLTNQPGMVYAIDGTTLRKVASSLVGLNSFGLIWRPL